MESTVYTVSGKEFELMHYGVKGMKWGVRKKPEPYIQDLGGGVTAKWPSKKAFKNAEKKRIKAEKKQFKDDVREARRKGLQFDYELDPRTGIMQIKQVYNSRGQKIGRDYAEKVMRRAAFEKTISVYAGTAAATIGLVAVEAMLGRR